MPLPSGLGLPFSKENFSDYKDNLIIIKRNKNRKHIQLFFKTGITNKKESLNRNA